jgi:hypothetical protein
MLRAILSVIAGVVTWMVIATGGNLALRFAWPGYAEAEPTMAFTLPMLLARLVLGAAASIGAGLVGAWVSRGSRRAVGILAAILLLFFLPVHYRLWDKFPVWYHAAFLISLVVLTVIGGMLYRLRRETAGLAASDHTAGS